MKVKLGLFAYAFKRMSYMHALFEYLNARAPEVLVEAAKFPSFKKVVDSYHKISANNSIENNNARLNDMMRRKFQYS